jgi:integrase
MPLMLKTQRDGTLRPFWYGVYSEDGERKVVNLNVAVKGIPPPGMSLKEMGDSAFERSRTLAESALQQVAGEIQSKGRTEHLIERLIKSKTGNSVEYVRLENLESRWMAGGDYSAGYIGQCKAVFARFCKFMIEANPKAEFAYQVSAADAQAFMNVIRAEMSRATTKAYIGILRPAFDQCLPHGMANPFRMSKSNKKKTAADAKEGKGFHRIPFSPAELQAVLSAAEEDELMHGLITACACTGMRRGDVCKLRWSDVDMQGGVVVAKASKTGETVEVPIFKPLRDVLQAAMGNSSEYVFPAAAEMLEANPDGLTWRFKKIVVKALAGTEAAPRLLQPPEDFDLEADGTAKLLKALPAGERRNRVVQTFQKYCAGTPMGKIAREVGCAKSTVVADLERAEAAIGVPVINRRNTENVKRDIASLTRAPRAHGQRAASVRDWHALRTTFVTLALSAGVPVELVKRVTGHQTTAIVMEHYFRPDREQFRAALTGALPEVLTGVSKPNSDAAKDDSRDDLTTLLTRITAGTATAADKKRFKALAAKV